MTLSDRLGSDGAMLVQWLSDEIAEADRIYGEYTSTHEALGVLSEEFDELRQAIHGNKLDVIESEALQVAAVALRLVRACHERASAFRGRSGA